MVQKRVVAHKINTPKGMFGKCCRKKKRAITFKFHREIRIKAEVFYMPKH